MVSGPQKLTKSKQSPKQLVVFLHGYGTNGDSLMHLGEQWSDALPDAEFKAPHGLESFEGSSSSYRWFPWIDFEAENVRPGLEKSAAQLAKILSGWLDERSLTTNDLAIVGFSQGMMVALELMFHLSGIRAIIGYSGAFYPPSIRTLSVQRPNILLVHGDADSGVPYSFMLRAGQELHHLGLNPQLETRPGLNHCIDQKGIQLGQAFLQKQFGNAD